MMNTLYLDVFSGISGDMFLGAMLDLGIELPQLERELGKLNLPGYHLHAVRRQNSNIEGIKFDVHLEDDHHHTHGGLAHAHPHQHADDTEHDHRHEHTEHEHEHEHEHGHHRPIGHEHEHHHDDGHEHEHGHAHAHGHGESGAEGAPDHHHHHGSRTFADIKQLIQRSSLSSRVKEKAIRVFERVAAAEGKIHGRPPEQVHFHEVGAVDSIVDIVGACIALEMLGWPQVLSAPVVEGTGWVDCAHGRFPVPTTATLEILGARGVALTQCEEPYELVTPTGAALLAEFAESFAPMKGLVASQIGYGLGTRQNKTRPNVLRAVLGTASAGGGTDATALDWESDTVAVLETNLDDCSAEILGYFVERALTAGALDVFHTPIQMKKNRPGVLLTVLCSTADADRFSEMLLRETSAFGVRRSTAERRKLRREMIHVTTPFGPVAVKLGKLQGRVLHAAPEFETCKQLAAVAHVPLREVYEAAAQASRSLKS